MGYSKESERQNEVLKSLLKGETPEKRVMVGYEGKKQQSGDKVSRLSDVMAEARMPWFCPSCKTVMKKRLDNKFWMKFGHCFDCQIKIENKLRIEGTYDEWEKNKIKENKISFIKENLEKLKEWKQQSEPVWMNNVGVNYPELEKEKWSIDKDKIEKEADEAIQKFEEELIKLESEE